MTVKVLIGDLFQSECQTWVNTVNCVGVMGKGVALEFRKRFPDMHVDYTRRCERREVRLGEPYLFKRLIPPWILNFPTKDHWRGLSRLSDIVEGLEYLKRNYEHWGIQSLAVPPLGSGQGQLDWAVVGPVLYSHLQDLDIPVELYAPHGSSKAELSAEFLSDERQRTSSLRRSTAVPLGLVATVEVLDRVQQEPFHWPVGRVTFQKVAYFATSEGLETGLEFERGSFGPFSPDLKLGVSRLINNGLVEERRRGQMFEIRVGPSYASVRNALASHLEAHDESIDRITDLFLRMNTKQAEVAASVHFTADELTRSSQRKPTEIEVLNEVMTWKRRRRPPIQPSEIASMVRHLAVSGWVDVEASPKLPHILNWDD